MLCIRAARLDEITRSFLAEHPAGPVLHLGCGLDARCRRVERNSAAWFDLDLPDVIELRRRFYDEGQGYCMLASSVTDLAWLDMVPRADDALVIAEGLTMYLRQEEVRGLFAALQDHFARVDLAFDAYSAMTARRAARHPSLAKTGATVRWGVDDPAEFERWGIGARVVEEWPFTNSEAIGTLKLGTRLLFRVAGWFRAARRAHRIIRLRLDHGSWNTDTAADDHNKREANTLLLER